MKINTCYTAVIKSQYLTVKKKKEILFTGTVNVDSGLMKKTEDICLKALTFCADLVQKEWDTLSGIRDALVKKRTVDMWIHSTADNKARYPKFDEEFKNMPSYVRRAVIVDAIGMVSSYQSNHKNWEALPVSERKSEPVLGLPEHYELTFYKQERNTAKLDKGIIGLKLYNGKTWDWYYFHINPSDARYICRMSKQRKMLSPVVEQKGNGYLIRFCFEENRDLVPDKPLSFRILAADLGINAPAS